MKHANSRKLTLAELVEREAALVRNDYPISKWITFCQTLLAEGYEVALYEARQTVSKYVTVTRKGTSKSFLVRFSNHKPNKNREEQKDCDYFVGVTHLGVTTTAMALAAVRKHFGEKV